MDYFVEQAPTDQEVHAIIRSKYGERARILSRKEVRTGGFLGLFQRTAVEVTGYCSHSPAVMRPRTSVAEERQKILETVRRAGGAAGRVTGAGQSTTDQHGSTSGADRSVNRTDRPTASEHHSGRSGESQPAQTGNTTGARAMGEHGNADYDRVLAEIRSLREDVARGGGAVHEDPPQLARIRTILEENDFSSRFSNQVISRLQRECTYTELADDRLVDERVVSMISEEIRVYPWQETARRPHVFVLVGPTGVGKTTTIAKLAAMYGAVADPSYDVRILTIDSYRIGALQQIQKYGEIMSIPVTGVETVGEMEQQLALNHDADFIFVDTIGKSPHDLAKLAEVNQLVRAAGGEVHLAISATTKRSDITEILRQFEPFNYQAVVITKLDETASVGGIVSALAEKQKSVSFITDGQRVPQDIERARVHTLLRRLRDLPAARHEAEALNKE